jgi:hypothetical protein
MAIANQLELAGKKPEAIYQEVIAHGVPPSSAAVLVGSWIYEIFGRAQRTFDYVQAFPAADPGCVSTFARTFVHQDWVDGESVVQAGQTPGEDGFNIRFHRIEADLEAVRADLVKAFGCLADMRQRLRLLLDEIRTEINRINNDIFQCCQRRELGPAVVSPPFGGLIENPAFAGVGKFGDRAVTLWKTDRGLFMLPSVQTVAVDVVTGDRVQRPAAVARLVEENAALREAFGAHDFTKKILLDRFGAVGTPDGRTLTELLTILPETAAFPNLGAMVNELTEREAAALRTTEGAGAVIAAAFGLETSAQTIDTAPVDQLKTLPAPARAVLLRSGIDTVGKLAAADPRRLADQMKAEGLTTFGTGATAEWVTTAKTLSKVR